MKNKSYNNVSKFIEETVEWGIQSGISVEDFGNQVGSGAYLLETIPTVLFILSKYIDDPQEAIIQAINNTKDNDTIGSIVGCAMGALYGKNAFKTGWVENLSGRIRDDDDGSVFQLISETCRYLKAEFKC